NLIRADEDGALHGELGGCVCWVPADLGQRWLKKYFPCVVQALCVFAGKQYSLGESWMDDACMHCTCLHPVGVGCCETVHRPVDFPAWCEVRVEPVTCKVFLVQTADPRQLCYPGETNQDPSHGSLHLCPRPHAPPPPKWCPPIGSAGQLGLP
uniref:Prostate-associated microseminoprotein n=1 Tax=Nothobranchius furzeri TaxID=105023 RepID=A0A8C6KTA9_NOTFU